MMIKEPFMDNLKPFFDKLWTSLPEVREFLDGGCKALSPYTRKAVHSFMDTLESGNSEGSFLEEAALRVRKELETADNSLFDKRAEAFLSGAGGPLELFFPEARFGGTAPAEQEDFIRSRRTVRLTDLNPAPVSDPASQMIFTSNVLLTLPPDQYRSRLSEAILEKVGEVEKEDQKYWFDHPILMGVETEANEMVYGLKGLAEAFAYEKKKGLASPESRMTVLLSLSVTHDGLKSLAHEYLASELDGYKGLEDLDIYIFTEEDTDRLSDLLESLLPASDASDIKEVFGVDGRYGRHYSFLKAVIPLWSIVMNPEVRGTFKIDLDQVFPQEELVKETGKTAFDHFSTPLWGARGKDYKGRDVELGMIAGALVNEKDISKSLFTPDVPLPAEDMELKGEAGIFHKQLPMAVSTLAEMMTRYGEPGMPDGKKECLSRVHVTGGTNGILCSTLRKKRPFTPAFIGRAEDQAYLLSVLFDSEGGLMRYVHEPGLIMRHDKEAFAGEAIAAAKMGTWVADLLRIIYFSTYAAFLEGGASGVKEELDPFTGCFITEVPMTKVFLRLLLKMLESPSDAGELLKLAEIQLSPFVKGLESAETVKDSWYREKSGWDRYYDALDLLEKGMAENRSDALSAAEKIAERFKSCRIS